jgi:hypothetical protein
MPCIVSRSRIPMFSHTVFYRCNSQLFCITYPVKIINTFKQGVWISSYKHADPSWLLELYNFNKATLDWNTRSVFFHHFLQYKPWLCLGVLWKMSIFCVSCFQLHILISDDCEAEILCNDDVILTAPPCQQFQSVPYFLLVRVASTLRGRKQWTR